MSDYSFLKTGFSMTDKNGGLDETQIQMICVLLKIFQEDSLITAGKYAIGCKRKVVSSKDVQKALMFQAQNFFDQGQSLEDRFNEYMNNDYEREEEEEEEEGGEEEEEEGGEGGEEEEGGKVEEEEECEENIDEQENEEFKKVVESLDGIYEKWNTWMPDDPIQILIKKSIDNISLDGTLNTS